MRNKLFLYVVLSFRAFVVPPAPSSGEAGHRDPGTAPGKRPASRRPSTRIGSFAALAFGAFLVSCLILMLMLGNAEKLVRLGLVGNLYYVVLVPLGLSVAAFLFGVLRSYAVYTGKVAGGNLELGGPIVGFLLVLILGFALVSDPSPFAVTVFVHGDSGKQDLVLRNRGAVLLDLGGDRRRELIGDRGQAYFAGIPSTFRGQDVWVLIEAEAYELVNGEATVKLNGQSLYLPVRTKAVTLAGYVKTTEGQPVTTAIVSVAGQRVKTDISGFFRLSVPGVVANESTSLQVDAPGYVSWNSLITPGGNEISVQLRREK